MVSCCWSEGCESHQGFLKVPLIVMFVPPILSRIRISSTASFFIYGLVQATSIYSATARKSEQFFINKEKHKFKNLNCYYFQNFSTLEKISKNRQLLWPLFSLTKEKVIAYITKFTCDEWLLENAGSVVGYLECYARVVTRRGCVIVNLQPFHTQVRTSLNLFEI